MHSTAYVALLAIAGCTPAPMPVRGAVTLDGKPLDEAVVLFVPLEPERRKTGAEIIGGRYKIADRDGLLPGRYRVEIADNPPLDGPRGKPNPHRRRIPPRYAHDSPLGAEVMAQSNAPGHEFNFQLKTVPTN